MARAKKRDFGSKVTRINRGSEFGIRDSGFGVRDSGFGVRGSGRINRVFGYYDYFLHRLKS